MSEYITDQPRYPLHDKLSRNREVAQVVADLYDKLGEKGIHLAEFDDEIERLYFARMTAEQFVGLALDIDPKALSAEKDLMLEDLRRMNRIDGVVGLVDAVTDAEDLLKREVNDQFTDDLDDAIHHRTGDDS